MFSPTPGPSISSLSWVRSHIGQAVGMEFFSTVQLVLPTSAVAQQQWEACGPSSLRVGSSDCWRLALVRTQPISSRQGASGRLSSTS